ncbi:MAG: hypothetical protein ACFBSF_12810 [Leptolyngbyaceae cyanobacterium]
MNSQTKQASDSSSQDTVRQPLNPEEVAPEQRASHKATLEQEDLAVNPGDRPSPEKPLEEKAKQVAVDAPDITGDHAVVPTYFVVEDPEEGQKALHHVNDAEEISDVIRQTRVDESGERTWR